MNIPKVQNKTSTIGSVSEITHQIGRDDLFKFYSRNSSLQIAENFTYYCMRELERIEGIHFSQLTINRDEFVDVFCWKKEFAAVDKRISQKLEKSKSIKDFFEVQALPIFKKYRLFNKRMHDKYAKRSSFSSEQLLKDYSDFAQINATFIAFNLFVYLSDQVLSTLLKEKLLFYLEKQGEAVRLDEYLVTISTPLKKPAVVKEQEGILRIAALGLSAKQYKDALKAHVEKYKWFPCYNPSDDAYSISHYEKELKKYTVQSAQVELKKIKSNQKKHRREFNNLLQKVRDKELKKLVLITNMVSYYREYRNDIRREGLCRIRPLYEKIAERFSLSVTEVCYMTNAEIKESLRCNKTVVPKKRIRSRMKNFVLFTSLEENILIDDAESVYTITQALKEKKGGEKIVKGQSAVKGIVRGKVRVVSHIKKLGDFTVGEVMVASMTGPEYVPAMKKCAAIVTDEGGITCHAAVIAREFNIPCVVGTKVATKVLADGDIVEVDANRGIIRKV